MSDYAMMKSQQQRRITKALEHLMGLINGLTADKHLSDEEIMYLDVWLKENPEVANCWPGDVLSCRVKGILNDGVIEPAERTHLMTFMQSISGNSFAETGSSAPDVAEIETDDGVVIQFDGCLFCFTGEFVYGTRACCERAIISRGGDAVSNVTKKVDYVVIGSRISPNWAHTSFGRKIQRAMDLKGDGHHVNVITESYWAGHL